MPEFSSLYSYRDFEATVKNKTRYFHGEKVRNFLTTVMETSASRTETINKSTVFCRAQPLHVAQRKNSMGPDERRKPALLTQAPSLGLDGTAFGS